MILRCDPCGVLCALLTYTAMIYADYVVITWLVAPTFSQSLWGVVHVILFNSVLILAFMAHFRAMVTDPGIVPISKDVAMSTRRVGEHLYGRSGVSESDNDESDSGADVMMLKPNFVGEDWSICTRCESYRPPRAHHCRVCRRCVRKMDHHSVMGGFDKNLLIPSSTALKSQMLDPYFHPANKEERSPDDFTTGKKNTLHTIFLSIESALFGLFVCAVSCDQLQAIFNDETAVEAVQRGGSRLKKVGRRSKKAMLGEVCGTDSVMMWLVPCSSVTSGLDVIQFAHDSQFEV